MTEDQFTRSQKGQLLSAILRRPGAIDRIIAASRADRPAVEAIDHEVAEAVGALSDPEKQAAGRVVKRVLGDFGLRPAKKGQRVLGGRVFSRGTVYREVVAATAPPAAGAVEAAPEAAARYQLARDILLAGRRDAAAPLDTVDGFLAARRSMWAAR